MNFSGNNRKTVIVPIQCGSITDFTGNNLQFHNGMKMEMDLNRMFATIGWQKLGLALLVCLALAISNPPMLVGQSLTRLWSDNSGTFSTQARLLKINPASVTLKKTNQVVIEVPFSRLSKIDLDFVKNEIERLNGITPNPVQQFGPAQSVQPNVSSRNTGERPSIAPQKVTDRLPNDTRQTNSSAAQPPLKYGAKPKEFEPEPVVAAEPILPDTIPAVIPTKDSVTSPPRDVARLTAPVKPEKEFSLGHPGPKQATIILKSPPQVASTELEPAGKSLHEIKSTFEDTPSEKTSFESSPSSNDLRAGNSFSPAKPLTQSAPISPPSTNDLRSQPFDLKPNTSLPTEPTPLEQPASLRSVEEQNMFGSKTDSIEKTEEPINSFQPPNPNTSIQSPPGSLGNFSSDASKDLSDDSSFQFSNPDTNFSPEPLDEDSAIVILPNDPQEKPDTNFPAIETTNNTSDSKQNSTEFSFDEGPDEVTHVFSRPPTLGPRESSFEPSSNPDFVASKESLAELPPRLQTLISRMVESKDPAEIRSALSEIQTDWPPQRYRPLVDVVQACVKAPEGQTRILAIQTLALRDQEKSMEHILSGVDDTSIDVREETHKLLEKLTDPRIIPALAQRLDSQQRQRIAGTLSKLGSDVEVHVVPFTTHASVDVQLTACNLLGDVGTQMSIKALQSVMATSNSARVRLQASNAIDRISSRAELKR